MEEKFSVPFEEHDLIGDVLRVGDENPSLLVLHGAGKANRQRYKMLRDFLLDHGRGSCAFDLIGHGDTRGDLSSSSLAHRTQQAMRVIEAQQLKKPLILIGASMGGYTAVLLTKIYPVESLILFVPGMYAESAYNLNFGTEFSKEIRKEHNWQESDAWDILSRYKGKLLVIGAEKDQTIPRELTQKIFDSAAQTAKKELYFVPDSPHPLVQYLSEQPEQKGIVFRKVLDFVG